MKNIHVPILTAFMLCPVLACDDGADPAVAQQPESALEPGDERYIIDSVDLGNGTFVKFVDEGAILEGGSVGVLMNAPSEAVLALVTEEDPSPLEMFLALTPQGAEVHARLLEDHAEKAEEGKVPAEPREFRIARETQNGPVTNCSDTSWCFVGNFWQNWRSGYGATSSCGETVSSSFGKSTGLTSTVRALSNCSNSSGFTRYYSLYVDTGSGWSSIYTYTTSTADYGVHYRISGSSARNLLWMSHGSSADDNSWGVAF